MSAPTLAAPAPAAPPRWKLIAAFAAVYLIWGSTYFAIRIVVETMPPFFMAGVRFATAGLILYALTWRDAGPRSDPRHWRSALIVGAMLLVGGNGLVSWAEQTVPSGLAALLIASTPLWMVAIPFPGRPRPTGLVMAGVVLGLIGIAVLVGPSELGGARPDPAGVVALLVAAMVWAIGSLLSPHLPQASSQLRATAMQMIAGGALLVVVGLLLGEGARMELADFSRASWLAWLYLVVFGSLIAFSAYMWLLRTSTPARVSTYAYINPLVAVFLGWLFLSEPLTPRVLVAAALILFAVALLTTRQR